MIYFYLCTNNKLSDIIYYIRQFSVFCLYTFFRLLVEVSNSSEHRRMLPKLVGALALLYLLLECITDSAQHIHTPLVHPRVSLLPNVFAKDLAPVCNIFFRLYNFLCKSYRLKYFSLITSNTTYENNLVRNIYSQPSAVRVLLLPIDSQFLDEVSS